MILKINQYIEIVFFLEKENILLRKYLNNLGITKIFINNENTIEQIIYKICNSNESDLSLEIEKLKKIIKENNVNIKKEKNNKIKIKKKEIVDYNKVIAIAGNYGSGKSLITALLGRAGKKLDIKTIIVDFDVINSSINTLFRVPKYNIDYKNNKLKNIIKISENLDIFCGVNMLFTEDNKINYDNVKTLFDDFRRNYNLILIDTSSETTLKYIKTVLYNVDKIVFLIEPNLLEIKKAEKLLEIYIEDWGVSTNKFDIVLNKVTAGSIDDTILNNIFNNFKIIEKIDFSNKYTVLANDIKSINFGLNKYVKILNNLNV